jgi:hypothetical protein
LHADAGAEFPVNMENMRVRYERQVNASKRAGHASKAHRLLDASHPEAAAVFLL